ncbi:uncharacterized protein SAZU_2815 [Streptomyces azureus]|uniref:Uncharacterized protein n=1 Tax=Streptomyces azureus TaxID=146537 RepID=A0A0K8PK22_STRAJ|nr:uncharacterized protein SAZU_2815 [Streptomyces azureus]
MPVLTDPAEVRKDLALATLSAITHVRHRDIGAIRGTHRTSSPTRSSNSSHKAWAGTRPRNCGGTWWPWASPFRESYISEKIRDEGRAEGEARRAAEDVLEVLDVRGIDVPEAVRERIVSCDDPETLRRWHRRAVIAPSAEQIFSDEQDK